MINDASFLQSGLGGLSFDEGQFSVFGYVIYVQSSIPYVLIEGNAMDGRLIYSFHHKVINFPV